MVSNVNRSARHSYSIIFIIGLILIAFSTDGQIFKKRKKNKENVDRTDYAYRTFSTFKQKKRKKGFAGDEAKFHFEKPKKAIQIEPNYGPFSTVNFGHKRPPHKHAPGHMKLCKVCGIKH